MDTRAVGIFGGNCKIWLGIGTCQRSEGEKGKIGSDGSSWLGKKIPSQGVRGTSRTLGAGLAAASVLWLSSEQEGTSACLNSSKCDLCSNKINSLGRAEPQALILAADHSLIAGRAVGRGFFWRFGFFFFISSGCFLMRKLGWRIRVEVSLPHTSPPPKILGFSPLY